MHRLTCSTCDAAWEAEFSYCPHDGTPLAGAAVCAFGPFQYHPTRRFLERTPMDRWAPRGWQARAEQRAAAARRRERRSVREAAPVGAELVTQAPSSLGAAPSRVGVVVFSGGTVTPSRAPESRGPAQRAPAEAPHPGPVAEAAAAPVAPGGGRAVSARPAIEKPETRSRRRPIAGPKRAPAEIVRELAQLQPEPLRSEEVPRAEGPSEAVAVHTGRKERSVAAFSDTAWFRRPLDAGQVNPETGEVEVKTGTYRRDPAMTLTTRRRFWLRRAGEEAG